LARAQAIVLKLRPGKWEMNKTIHPFFTRASSLMLRIASYVFVAAAFYHLLAVFIVLNDSTTWRNLIFVLINIGCAIEIRNRKPYFVFLFSALFIQQVISHGSVVISSCQGNHTDWLGIGTLAFMTLTYASLIISKSFETRRGK